MIPGDDVWRGFMACALLWSAVAGVAGGLRARCSMTGLLCAAGVAGVFGVVGWIWLFMVLR